jgi:hypothetical protein
MVGVIRGLDVLSHPIVTIRCFGWRVFFQAVAPWQTKTFLSLLTSSGFAKASIPGVATILERCINLELRAKRIYMVLGKALKDEGFVGLFFSGLAEQEQYHADLLEICRTVAGRHRWRADLFNPWQDYLPRLEKQMDAAELAVREIKTTDAALRLVIQLESSEINEVFPAALAATDAVFVKKLKPFRDTVEAHLDHIVEQLPRLSPRLMLEARELRARFPRGPRAGV